MKKLIFLSVILVLCGLLEVPAQVKVKDDLQKELLDETPREMLFAHINSGLLFPGEYLLYKIYALNAPSGELSELSSIAYVELVGEGGEQIFFQKVPLENGTGQASFFVPTSIPSGNYKLIAYTNWMRNEQEQFFQEDMVIINPYRSNQDRVMDEVDSAGPTQAAIGSGRKTSDFRLEIDKNSYGNREKVSIALLPPTSFEERANLSVSVRKLSVIPSLPKVKTTAVSFDNNGWKKGDSLFLPELRGELFRGRIVPKTAGKAVSLKDQKIALSIPGEGPFPLVSSTDKAGRFYFNLDKYRQGEEVVIEVLGQEKDSFNIEVEKTSGVDVSSVDFGKFQLTPKMKQEIIQRSVYNQIENAYFEVKPDTLVADLEDSTFYSSRLSEYELDAYTRFKTVPETFVEIIGNAWIRTTREGNQVFEVRAQENSLGSGQLPLVVIDGVNIQDHQDLISMNAATIKSIGIIRDEIYIGPQIYKGAILVKTVGGDYLGTYSRSYAEKMEIQAPEIRKRYFKQQYEENATGSQRIPDFRYQLLWEPELKVGNDLEIVNFYTSDVDGTFEVVIEGFTENGKPISIREVFSVD